MDTESIDAPPPKKQKIDVPEASSESLKQDKPVDFSEDVLETENKEFSVGEDMYSNYTDPEELEKLRQFQVLDEVKSNDEDSDEESESSDGKSEGVPEEELEKMLDENLPEELKATRKPKNKPYVTRQKIVLEEKGVNHLEVLPLDWMMARHYSGMPVFIHRTTRVCTLSKPYFLGKGNTRRHDIPISAIPCLAYRRALEEEAKQEEIDRTIQEQIVNGTWKDYTPTTDIYKKNTTQTNQNTTKVKTEVENCTSTEHKANSESIEGVVKENSNQSKCPFNHKALEKCTTNAQVIEDLIPNGDIESKKTSHESDISEITNDLSATASKLNDIDTPNVEIVETVNARVAQEENSSTNDNEEENKTEDTEMERPSDAGVSNKDDVEVPKEVTNLDEIPLNRRPVVLPGGIVMPPPRIETVNDSWKTQHLTHEQVNEYCKKLFKFKFVNIMHFNRWADRRKYTKARKTLQYPTLPEGTKLITIPAQNGQDSAGKPTKRDWVMNMNGRSCLSVFHEYVRRALQQQPVYEFKQLQNSTCPYQAQVFIGGMQYGVGRGSSKRQAKSHAARHAFHVLLPTLPAADTAPGAEPDFTFFDYVGIEDPRIGEFCAATCEPSPHAILRTCLLRNFGAGERHIHTEMKKLEYQKIELTMSVGKHKATVVCKNKKTAKQRASQAILQALHPHVTSWGSLLRLYGSRSVKSCKEKKLEEQQITLLQDKARHNEPNYAVLDKLRTEMRRLKERDAAIVPIGTLLLQHDLPSHSASNLNNVDL